MKGSFVHEGDHTGVCVRITAWRQRFGHPFQGSWNRRWWPCNPRGWMMPLRRRGTPRKGLGVPLLATPNGQPGTKPLACKYPRLLLRQSCCLLLWLLRSSDIPYAFILRPAVLTGACRYSPLRSATYFAPFDSFSRSAILCSL